MAVPIEVSSSLATAFVAPTSRYSSSDVLLYGKDKILTFATFKRQVTELTEDDKFAVIPPGEEFRPDLTSFRAYGTVDFWWQIMQVNKIYDIFDYKAGKNIRIPSPLNII